MASNFFHKSKFTSTISLLFGKFFMEKKIQKIIIWVKKQTVDLVVIITISLSLNYDKCWKQKNTHQPFFSDS